MDTALRQQYTHPDAMRGASRKKQNALMHKELNNFERVIAHALSRFKLDMWYDMLSEVVPEDMEVNSLAALQDLVQSEKDALRESGEDPNDNIIIMYFRDFFRDVGQLRRMKDIFHSRIYSVLFEYYYDVDSIQEISDVAKSSEEKDKHEKRMSKKKKKNLSKVQNQNQSELESRFPPEVVSELASDCVEISGLIGELKRLVFSWGRLLNDPEIEAQLFSTGNDDQFAEYEDYDRFEGVFRFVPDILQKSHQAIVLARNWWFKAEKIQNRLSKIMPPLSSSSGTLSKGYADNDGFDDSEDEQLGDKEFEEKFLSEEVDFNEDDIMEDYGENTLSEEEEENEDIFLTSDPGAIVIEKNKTPVMDEDEVDDKDEYNEKEMESDSRGTYRKIGFDDQYAESQDEQLTDTEIIENEPKNDLPARKQASKSNKHNAKDNVKDKSKKVAPRDKKKQTVDKKTPAKTNNSSPVKRSNKKKADRKPLPARQQNRTKPPKDFVTEVEEEFVAKVAEQFENESDFNDDEPGDEHATADNEQTAREKLQELNSHIDAHQRELDVQIDELKNLVDRNKRVKTLCESLEETIESQIAQRKKAEELMTVKESLEELKEQDTTTPAKEKKIQRHLDKINKELDGLLKSGKVTDYQNELLKEDLDLQLAVSPRLASYGHHVQDQIEALEEQLEEERLKLADLHREYDVMSRRSRVQNRRQERLKAAEIDGKSFSADAVNKSRRDDVLRNRAAQKPPRHSDGSVGGTPRQGQSASSDSVFLNEGDVDIEEYNEDDYDEEIADIEDDEIAEIDDDGESFEDDSGVGDTWEDIGKPSVEFPRTPAIIQPKQQNKRGNKNKSRPVKQEKLTLPKINNNSNKKDKNERRQKETISSPSKSVKIKESNSPSKVNPKKRHEAGDQKSSRKQPTKSSQKTKPTKQKKHQPSAVNDLQEEEEEVYDNEDEQDEQEIDEVNMANSFDDGEGDEFVQDEGESGGEEEEHASGLGMFSSKYSYPLSNAENSIEEDIDTWDRDQTRNSKATSNNNMPGDKRLKDQNNQKKPSEKQPKQPSKARSDKKRKSDKEQRNNVALKDNNDEAEADEQEEQNEQTSENTEQKSNNMKRSQKPPTGSKNKHQPKPPTTDKSNKTRTRGRATNKEMSTSDDELQSQEQGKTRNRESRSKDASKTRRGRSKSKDTRSRSRGRAAAKREDQNNDGSSSSQNGDKEKVGGRKKSIRRKGAKEEPEARKDSRPPWKSIYKTEPLS